MTDSDIIAALGGTAKVARELSAVTGVSVSPKRASNWPLRGIPPEFRPAIAGMLTEIGKEVPDGFLLGIAAGAKLITKMPPRHERVCDQEHISDTIRTGDAA